MIIPKNLEELASYVDSDQKVVFFFTADWCPDCQLDRKSTRLNSSHWS